ncbi:hypothetical protein V5799_021624 [Amblyomma americanum]|uniref:Uncharacterized protein n=1 Tax=Amblyomma americanum TaxID=6943 RepID=A0AAQ4FNC0_AMBAM
MNLIEWLAQHSEDTEPPSSIDYVYPADVEVEDHVDLGPFLNFLLGPVIAWFLCCRQPEGGLKYVLLLSFCLLWAYWQTRQKAAYHALVRKYLQPPPHCRQGYKFPWTSVSDDNIEGSEAFRLFIAMAPLPMMDPLFEVADPVNELFLNLLQTIGKALKFFAIALLITRTPFAVLVTLVVVFHLTELADDLMR